MEAMKKLFPGYESRIDNICFIINAPDRVKDFRVFSNAKQNSPWETETTKPGINAPDNYFISNNYFYNIERFIIKSEGKKQFEEIWGSEEDKKVPLVASWAERASDKNISDQKEILSKKFVSKYLWMLGNRNEVIVLFSMKSFLVLLHTSLLKDFEAIFELNEGFDDFVEKWQSFSHKVFKELGVTNEERLSFSKWFFTLLFSTTNIKSISELLTTGNKAVILWGPPGTGKTYESLEVVRELLEIGEDENLEENYLFSKGPADRNTKGYFEIVQFHPNYTYQEFIGGIFPKLEEGGKEVSYTLRHGVFKRFCDAAADASDKKFIFIIDEINRAELSAVFGELLYALEYRGKSIFLPHFGEFAIPKNVYIIGTMNNVDKSLVTFDLALRRRFGFFKLMPKPEVIKDALSGRADEASLTPYYDRCTALNEAIVGQLDLGEDYQIGQAYFLKIGDFLPPAEAGDALPPITSFELEKLWLYHIEPLLEEYLGMSIEDEGIAGNLSALKDPFTKEL